MRKKLLLLTAVSVLASAQGWTTTVRAASLSEAAADLGVARTDSARLAAGISIPHESFTLENGLRVVVHTDRSAPLVSVSVWYNVGSKHEPAGRSGFAHLFEHLMFNGTENVPGDFFKPLQEAGASDINGTTSADRTNYYQTVPTGALERVLFMESDRMGHLLGAVDQARLDEQRGVVQNEKRQGANSPYAIIRQRLTPALYPAGHPYGHEVIGSLADLDAADLDDVRRWFHAHYGPNNAVLVLAGDIDVATARRLVQTYFGDIPRGPDSDRVEAPVPTLPAEVRETVTAPIPAPVIVRAWAVPGNSSSESLVLDVAAGLLGDIDAAPLTRSLVRERKLFSSLSAVNETLAQAGKFRISGTVAAGVDADVAAKALDDAIAQALQTPPSQNDLDQWVTGRVVSYAQSLESLSTRASLLASGILTIGDSNGYRRDLEIYSRQTPEEVMATARKWLSRPVYALQVMPGAAVVVEEVRGAPSTGAAETVTETGADTTASPVRRPRGAMPGVGDPTPVVLPRVERARLSNGIPVIYARKTTTPFTTMMMAFDAGSVVDPVDRIGLQSLANSLLTQGAGGHPVEWIEAVKERLGIYLGAGSSKDSTMLTLTAPSVSLTPALDLTAMVLTSPEFSQEELERARAQLLAMIKREATNSDSLAFRVFSRLVDGASPYTARAGMGDPRGVEAVTREDLIGSWNAWMRPEKAKILVISDRPLDEILPQLEARFGHWTAPGAAGAKTLDWTPAPASPRIVLINRPGSTQAALWGGERIDVPTDDDQLRLNAANSALGGSFLSRINMNIREDKHWAYGASSGFVVGENEAIFMLSANVQQDKAGPAIVEMEREARAFLGNKPMTRGEYDLAIDGSLRSMPGWFVTAGAILGVMQENERHGRPDDYLSTLRDRYSALTPEDLTAAMRRVVNPDRWVWTVVGDADILRPQLEALGLPVEVMEVGEVMPPS